MSLGLTQSVAPLAVSAATRKSQQGFDSRLKQSHYLHTEVQYLPSFLAISNFFGFMSTAMMRSAPAILAPWTTERPCKQYGAKTFVRQINSNTLSSGTRKDISLHSPPRPIQRLPRSNWSRPCKYSRRLQGRWTRRIQTGIPCPEQPPD